MTRPHLSGFSLLELSVVLAIVAVILVFGLNIATVAIKGTERSTTQERLLVIAKALDAYARVNGYLPCPANRALAPRTTGFATEARNGMVRTECVTSSGLVRTAGAPFAYIGGVPARTLGLPDAYAGDAWNSKFTYAVSGDHVGVQGSYFTTDGPLAVRAGDRTGTNYLLTSQRESDGTNASGANAVYVVISHGPDRRGAFSMERTSVSIACGSTSKNDVENCDDANLTFYDSAYNDGGTESTFFDDYVVWGSNALDRIPTAMGGVGTGCPAGTCEMWCVTCDSNRPPLSTPNVICKRTITSTSPCKALCEYAYPTANVFCP